MFDDLQSRGVTTDTYGLSQSAPQWTNRLRSAGSEFRDVFLPLEPMFLATGERLRDLRGQVSTLTQRAEAAGALLSSPEFGALLSGLNEAISHIEELGRHRGGLVDMLGRMVGSLDVLMRSLVALGRIMFHIRVLAVNARIEAAQIVAADTDFSVFVRGISEVARTGDQTIGAVRHELDSLRTAATGARDGQRAFEQQGLAELDALAVRLVASVWSLRQHQEAAAHGVVEIPGHLLRLFSRIGGLVSNLQAYDVIRQRLQHLVDGREDAARMIETGAVPANEEAQVQLFVNAVADLQALQMLHTGDEYHQVVTDVGRNLTAMAEGVPELATLCTQAFGGGDGARSLLEIEADVKKARALLEEFKDHRGDAEANLAQVVAAAARADDLMRRLNGVHADMRLMGLNASIKCGNLGGRARALNVIAQEIQGYATRTHGHVEAIVAGLGTITTAVRELGSGSEESWLAGTDGLRDILDQTIARLEQTGAEVAELLGEIGTLGPQIADLTRTTEAGFSGSADCRRAVERSVAALTALAVATAPDQSGSALESVRDEMLAFVESRYTMASERIVHDAITGKGSPPAPPGEHGAAHETPASPLNPGGDLDISHLLF